MISLLFAVTLPFYPPGQHLGGYGMTCDINGKLHYEHGGVSVSAVEFEKNVPGTGVRQPFCDANDNLPVGDKFKYSPHFGK